jgi:hypothetical protein
MSNEPDSERNSEDSRIEVGRQRVVETASSPVDGAEEFARKFGDEVPAKADVAVVFIASQTAGAALAIKQAIDSAVGKASNTVQAVGDTVAWIIEHVEHMSVVDRESDTNYHRIRAVGDASEFLRRHLNGLGLDEYDIRVEASLDSIENSEDVLIVEIYKPTAGGEKPKISEPIATPQ